MKINLSKLPMDVIIEIVFTVIISEITSKNYKKEPFILSSHPIFLSSLKYFTDDKWKVICNIITNSPEKLNESSWKKTFFKLQNTDLYLLNLTLNGNFGNVRRIDLKKRLKKGIIPKTIVDGLFKFKNNLEYLESDEEKGCLLQLLRQFSSVRIERKSFDYFSKLIEDILKDKLNGKIKYKHYGIHILRELVNIRDEFNISFNTPQEISHLISSSFTFFH